MNSSNQASILTLIPKVAFIVTMFSTVIGLNAQVSGNWDSFNTTSGSTGYTNYGNGVIQLVSSATGNGCQGAAVHETSAKYNPSTDGVFSRCYKTFFGCPGNDVIGGDSKGDGMAFSFSQCNGFMGTCGGGLGYHDACGNKMMTIEFDTYSSWGNNGFDDPSQGQGASGTSDDQVAIQRNAKADNTGYVYGVNPGNLEDGLEHDVCITYDPATDIYTVSIDGSTILTYDATGTGNELEVYFNTASTGGLNQSWSSGKDGATNPATVSHGQDITDQIGATPLCPSSVTITSPADFTYYASCPTNPTIPITATATPPSGNTISSIDFYDNGVLISSDATSTYNASLNTPADGTHLLTAIAHYTPSGTSSTSTAISAQVGGIKQASGITIDGSATDWSTYGAYRLDAGTTAATDIDGFYKIAYTATTLYMMIDVTDDVLRNDGSPASNYWEDDGVEVMIDINDDGTGAYTGDDWQFDFMWNSNTAVHNYTEYKRGNGSVTYVHSNKPGNTGYVVEFSIPWTSLKAAYVPAAGSYLGIEVKVDDDDDGGTRDSEVGWKDGAFGSWNNTSLFGSLQFMSCSVLPVSLLNFDGALQDEVVILNWVTNTEINNAKFTVQRSTNNSDWNSIGSVAGAGNSNSVINYAFPDYEYPGGVAYYRLVQEDFDGKTSNSNIVTVQDKETICILPNPFDNQLVIASNLKGKINISIHDVVGKTVYEESRDDANTIDLHLELAPGSYVVTVQSGSFLEHHKVIRK